MEMGEERRIPEPKNPEVADALADEFREMLIINKEDKAEKRWNLLLCLVMKRIGFNQRQGMQSVD